MNNELKKLHKYLVNNGFKKEARDLNIIIKEAFLGLLLPLLLTGCSKPNLVFGIEEGVTFTDYPGVIRFQPIKLNATSGATIQKIIGSFDNYTDSDADKHKAHSVISQMHLEGFIDPNTRSMFYNGTIDRENIIINECKKLKVCYFNIIFNKPSDWQEGSPIVYDSEGTILNDSGGVDDSDLSGISENWEDFIFTEGIKVYPVKDYGGDEEFLGGALNIKFRVSKNLYPRVEDIMNELSLTTDEKYFEHLG